MSKKLVQCKHCQHEIAASAKTCTYCGGKNKTSVFRKWWFDVIIVLVVIAIATSGKGSSSTSAKETPAPTKSQVQATSTISEAADKSVADSKSSKDDNVPTEYKSALKKAKSYSDLMHMSKNRLYDQLTSEYGERFSAEAAQYAIDNLQADWNANALATAKNYSDTMYMSKAAIYDQLTSEYGEQFTAEEAQYAIDNLN